MIENSDQYEILKGIILREVGDIYTQLTELKADMEQTSTTLCSEINKTSEFSVNSLRNFGALLQSLLEQASKVNLSIIKKINEIESVVSKYTETQMERHLEQTRRTLQIDIVAYTNHAVEMAIDNQLLPVMGESIEQAKKAILHLSQTANVAKQSLSAKRISRPILILSCLIIFTCGGLTTIWTQQRFLGTLSAKEQTWIETGKSIERIWPSLDEKTKNKILSLNNEGN